MHIREVQLRQLAHERLESGDLPRVRAGVGWTGAVWRSEANGEHCDLCGAPILFEEVDHKLTARRGDWILKFHLTCHAVWVAESTAEVSEYADIA